MAQTRRKPTTPADPAAALTAEMARPLTFFDVLDVGDNEARWTRLVELCEEAWRADSPANFPPAAKRVAVAERFNATLPKALRADWIKLDDWQGALVNIYADAGFRLGLAIGRGGAR